ncbi:GPI transamidase component [Vermiconidia calcicola]|uniref:GPI transamidase component n=1 Tax=Vermiconidia calcicola TaxID=1690605 RepID=A0ACC3NMX4_9PEZI|nr:GPI transamidase component [Vermiconidia calcicola]
MNRWADGKACQLHYPLYIGLTWDDYDISPVQDLASQVQSLLRAENDLSLYDFYIIADTTTAETSQRAKLSGPGAGGELGEYRGHALSVNVITDPSTKSTSASLRTWRPVLDVRHNPERSVDSATLAPFIASEIRKIYEHENDAISHLLRDTPFTTSGQVEALSPEVKSSLDARRTRAFKYAATYHLTFSLFTSSASPSAWEAEQALEDSIRPLLDRFSSISEFTVDTQVQLLASFSPSIAGPQYDESTREWKLQRTDLSGFVNAAEWPLNPGIGSGPTINFVLFVPSEDQSPLVLAETGGNSWLIPQWGGVQILNPSGKQSEKLSAADLRPVMLTFADQLSALLGLPDSPASPSLRISSLVRERATSLVLSASSTLGALARLSLKLTSIAIPDSVAKSVDETILRLDQACHDLRDGRYHRALENARTAEGEAEQAFFEPSMVGQVYFPEEHKVAVYVPLLGPMAVPLVMAALKEFRKLRATKAKVA